MPCIAFFLPMFVIYKTNSYSLTNLLLIVKLVSKKQPIGPFAFFSDALAP